MRSTIKTIAPQMDGHEQRTYDGQHGTMYCFVATLADGTTGQVSSKSPAPHRFVPGDEVEYKFTPGSKPSHMGRLTVEKPKDVTPPQNGELPRASGWSPAKEASVMIQGILKSVVESGAPKEQWQELVNHGVSVHDATLRARIALKNHAAPPAQQAQAPAPAPVAKPQPVALADMPEDDLPF